MDIKEKEFENVLHKEAPHQAIVKFEIGVYERDSVGRCLPPQVYNKSTYYTIHANTYEELQLELDKFKEVFTDAKRQYEESAI